MNKTLTNKVILAFITATIILSGCSLRNPKNDQKDSLNLFKGEYISAEYPDDWKIVEYFDGENMEDGEGMKGLTGLDIINAEDETLFRLNVITGLGGSTFCNPIFLFEDTSEEYINEIKNNNDKWFESTYELLNLEKNDFNEIIFLGHKLRIKDTKYFIDSSSADEYFNPYCSDVESITLVVEDLEFECWEDKCKHYYPEFTSEINQQDKATLYEILKSMQVN